VEGGGKLGLWDTKLLQGRWTDSSNEELVLEIDGDTLRLYVVDPQCAAAATTASKQPSDPAVPARDCKGVLTDTVELPKLSPNHESRFSWFWEIPVDVPQRGGETVRQFQRCTINVECRVAGSATPQTNIDDFIQLSLVLGGVYAPGEHELCLPGKGVIAASKDPRVAGLLSRGKGRRELGGEWVFLGPVKEADFRPKTK